MFGVEARTSLFTFAIVLSDFFIALFVALVTLVLVLMSQPAVS